MKNNNYVNGNQKNIDLTPVRATHIGKFNI